MMEDVGEASEHNTAGWCSVSFVSHLLPLTLMRAFSILQDYTFFWGPSLLRRTLLIIVYQPPLAPFSLLLSPSFGRLGGRAGVAYGIYHSWTPSASRGLSVQGGPGGRAIYEGREQGGGVLFYSDDGLGEGGALEREKGGEGRCILFYYESMDLRGRLGAMAMWVGTAGEVDGVEGRGRFATSRWNLRLVERGFAL